MGSCNFKYSKNFSGDLAGNTGNSPSANKLNANSMNLRLKIPAKPKFIKILNPKNLTLRIVREVPQEFEYSPIV